MILAFSAVKEPRTRERAGADIACKLPLYRGSYVPYGRSNERRHTFASRRWHLSKLALASAAMAPTLPSLRRCDELPYTILIMTAASGELALLRCSLNVETIVLASFNGPSALYGVISYCPSRNESMRELTFWVFVLPH